MVDPDPTALEAPMGHARHATLVIALLLPAMVAGCATSSATSGSRPGSIPAGSQPSGSSGPATTSASGTYVPASGTDPKSGLLFDTYTSAKLGYRLIYPGGWNVTRAGTTVRIAKFGNVIVIAERPAGSAPKAKGDLLAVTLPARTVSLSAGRAVRVVFTQARQATATNPAATLLVDRYILYHDGKVVVLSMQGPQEFDNRLAYRLIAHAFAWA
jgi:hypothetical protein